MYSCRLGRVLDGDEPVTLPKSNTKYSTSIFEFEMTCPKEVGALFLAIIVRVDSGSPPFGNLCQPKIPFCASRTDFLEGLVLKNPVSTRLDLG